MSGYANDERKANYYGPIVTGGNRELYDERAEELQKTLYNRHTDQLSEAKKTEGIDSEWIEDKNRVIELNKDIRVRRKNFDTYKNAIEIEKTLYNRERHNTMLLGFANAIALGGCLYVWLA